MAPGVPGLEFEAHGHIAPADLKVGGNCGECDRKPAKNRIPGGQTTSRTSITVPPAHGLKSDRLLERVPASSGII